MLLTLRAGCVLSGCRVVRPGSGRVGWRGVGLAAGVVGLVSGGHGAGQVGGVGAAGAVEQGGEQRAGGEEGGGGPVGGGVAVDGGVGQQWAAPRFPDS